MQDFRVTYLSSYGNVNSQTIPADDEVDARQVFDGIKVISIQPVPPCLCLDPIHPGDNPACKIHGVDDDQTRCIISGGEVLEIGATSPIASTEIPMPWGV